MTFFIEVCLIMTINYMPVIEIKIFEAHFQYSQM
ncbi:hypothetical protein T05_1297 [Trichinella murrelli]|uniref:Uncharacterized protein n=1 Tax=Trichinella murrelli TaxID=144512 RepID=A0A0V0SPU1_9BILA|nr:hypothetical protein T05_1297 [Trichinella murrelli]